MGRPKYLIPSRIPTQLVGNFFENLVCRPAPLSSSSINKPTDYLFRPYPSKCCWHKDIPYPLKSLLPWVDGYLENTHIALAAVAESFNAGQNRKAFLLNSSLVELDKMAISCEQFLGPWLLPVLKWIARDTDTLRSAKQKAKKIDYFSTIGCATLGYNIQPLSCIGASQDADNSETTYWSRIYGETTWLIVKRPWQTVTPG